MSESADKPKPRRRWFSFSLRTLLVVMLLVGCGLIPFAVRMERARRHKAAVEWVMKTGGEVWYNSVDLYSSHPDGFFFGDLNFDPPNPSPASSNSGWYGNLFGDGDVERVVGVVIAYRDVVEISPLAELGTLKELMLPRVRVKDLLPLEGLTNLEYLDLSETPVTDLSPLKSLTKLKRLYLSESAVADLSPLKRLTSLEGLYLAGAPIKDISAVEGLAELKDLHLERTRVSDISVLEGLTNLTRLSLTSTRVTDLSPLERAKGLTHLELRETPVTDEQVRNLQRVLPNCWIGQ